MDLGVLKDGESGYNIGIMKFHFDHKVYLFQIVEVDNKPIPKKKKLKNKNPAKSHMVGQELEDSDRTMW